MSSFKQAILTISAPGGERRRVTLRYGRTYVVGRSSGAAILLQDAEISRRHALLELREDGLYVTDPGSANGVVLGGRLIPPQVATRLSPADTIHLAHYSIAFELVGYSPQEDQETRRRVSWLGELAQRFSLGGMLGKGGQGFVLRAYDEEQRRPVAIKILNQAIQPNSEEEARFRREGELLRRVSNPHVVEIYDMLLLEDRPVILLELVDGPSALERLQSMNHHLPVVEVLRLGAEVVEGLAAVHAAGIVHRDVKPSNILLGPDGAKLADFGIAKLAEGPSMTRTKLGMGTLVYVSPEQAANAKRVDHRADIYGLGATLYHLLAWRPPFDTRLPFHELLELIHSAPPLPLRDARPDLAHGAASLVHRMLSKDPADRPQSISEVALELRRLRSQLGEGGEAGETAVP